MANHRGHRGHRDLRLNELTGKIIGCAIEVHKTLGPGLLESTYEQCLSQEFSLAKIPFKVQWPLPVTYKGMQLDCGYRVDIFVDKRVIIELKAVGEVKKIHEAQLLTYMKLANIEVGLLINFNVEVLKNGIKRFKY